MVGTRVVAKPGRKIFLADHKFSPQSIKKIVCGFPTTPHHDARALVPVLEQGLPLLGGRVLPLLRRQAIRVVAPPKLQQSKQAAFRTTPSNEFERLTIKASELGHRPLRSPANLRLRLHMRSSHAGKLTYGLQVD